MSNRYLIDVENHSALRSGELRPILLLLAKRLRDKYISDFLPQFKQRDKPPRHIQVQDPAAIENCLIRCDHNNASLNILGKSACTEKVPSLVNMRLMYIAVAHIVANQL